MEQLVDRYLLQQSVDQHLESKSIITRAWVSYEGKNVPHFNLMGSLFKLTFPINEECINIWTCAHTAISQTFRKDVDPSALVHLLQSEVHRLLINAITSRYRDGFAHTEESLMSPRGENDIVSPQRPAHSWMIPEYPKWHYRSWNKKLGSIPKETSTEATHTKRERVRDGERKLPFMYRSIMDHPYLK